MQDTTFKVGDRVELHPALDDWMRGDRFGEVADVTFSKRYQRTTVHVRLDRSGRVRRYGVEALSYVAVPRQTGVSTWVASDLDYHSEQD